MKISQLLNHKALQRVQLHEPRAHKVRYVADDSYADEEAVRIYQVAVGYTYNDGISDVNLEIIYDESFEEFIFELDSLKEQD